MITWPAKVRSCPMSMTASPVTQTAEADVKRASTKESPFVEENGKIKEDCAGQDHAGETEDEDPLRREDPRDENIQVQLMFVLHKGV